MDPKDVLRQNLKTFTLEELKKEVIKMKHLNFAVTSTKHAQVVNLMINYHCLFPHLMNKTGTKKVTRPKTVKVTASIKLPALRNPKSLAFLAQQALPKPKPELRTRKNPPKPAPRKIPPPKTAARKPQINNTTGVPEYVLRDLGLSN